MCFLSVFFNQGFTQDVSKIRIDPSHAYGGKASDFFEAIEYIPLETNSESLFGDVYQMVATDSTIVISDYDTRSVLFFTTGGKYITKVKIREDESPVIAADLQKREIVIKAIDKSGNVVSSYFTFKGQHKKNRVAGKLASKAPNLTSIGDGFYAVLNSGHLYPNKTPKDSIYHLIDIYKDTSLYKSFLPFNQKKQLSFSYLAGSLGAIQNNSISDGSFYTSTPYDFYVYKVNKDSAIRQYQFVFPSSRVVPTNVLTSDDLKYLDSLKYSIEHNPGIICEVRNIFFLKNRLFFRIIPGIFITRPSSEEFNQYNFVYDTISGQLASLERITPDEKSSFLPFVNNGFMTVIYGLYFSSGCFYSSVSSLQMFAAKENTQDKHPQYPPALQAYFNTQNRKSNPVIVKMKLKD